MLITNKCRLVSMSFISEIQRLARISRFQNHDVFFCIFRLSDVLDLWFVSKILIFFVLRDCRLQRSFYRFAIQLLFLPLIADV